MKKCLNTLGVSLVELTIAGAMMSGMVLMGMRLVDFQQKSSKGMAQSFDEISITNEIRSILVNPNSCLETLNGLNALSDNAIVNIKKVVNVVGVGDQVTEKYPQNVPLGTNNLTIAGYRVESNAVAVTDPNNEVEILNGAFDGTAYFYIMFDRGEKSTKVRRIEKKIKLNVSFAAVSDGVTASINACAAVGGDANSIWSRVPLTQNIFYSDGNVAVGKNVPDTRLDVNGTIKVGDGACNARTQGSIRYNAGSQRMEYCKPDGGGGQDWAGFGNSGPPVNCEWTSWSRTFSGNSRSCTVNSEVAIECPDNKFIRRIDSRIIIRNTTSFRGVTRSSCNYSESGAGTVSLRFYCCEM